MTRTAIPHVLWGVVTLVATATPLCAQSQSGYAGRGAESVPREKIAKYAPPPLPSEVTRRIQAMLDVRGAVPGMIGPDGKRLFFTWNVTGTPNVWRLDGPRSFPVQMTGGEDPTRLAGVTPDGRVLLLLRDAGGQETPGLYTQRAEGGPLTVIHHKAKTRAGYAFTTDDSKTVYFTANDIKEDSYAIYRYDLATRQRELVFDQPGLWSVSDHRADAGGLKLLLSKATGALSREYVEYDVATRTLTPLLGQNEKVEYQAAYAASPGEFFVLTNKLGEFRRLYRWKPGEALTPVTADMGMDVSGFSLDDAKTRLYLSLNDRGYQRLRVQDARSLSELELPTPADAAAVTLGSLSPNGHFAVVAIDSGKAPRTSFVLDWRTRSLTEWALATAPEVDAAKFVAARLENYTARDGTKIPMFVRYPPQCAPELASSADPCPVIVEFHGGPELQATPTFRSFAQIFVDAGFIYAEPNVRGSDGYGRAWLDADNGAKRLDVISDIDDAGKALRARFTRNGKAPKVAIAGGSYGGYSVFMGMTMFAGTYDAGVSIVGISNLSTFLQNTAPDRRALRASEYGDPEKDAEALKKLSPTSYLDRLKAPLLIIQGLDDPRVPAGEAVQIQEALEARGLSSRLILLEGEGHGAARRGGQVLMAGHMLRFLEEHLTSKTGAPTN
jgi:protease II